MIEKIKSAVQELFAGKDAGHGFDHILRVYHNAMELCTEESANREIVAMAALLHDADDYKLFGQECADHLTNAKRIMREAGVDEKSAEKVCNIINNMGYSKALKGIRPASLEGQIVSDADMLDAIGAISIVRTLTYTVSSASKVIFNPEIFPEENLTQETYKEKNRKADSFVNHFFDKLLKLKYMMFTNSGRAEAEIRHETMVTFLYSYFREQNLENWIAYLEAYEQNNVQKIA